MGKAPEGEDHLRRALALRVKSLKPGHSAIAGTQGALGECLAAQRRYAEAEPLLTESHKHSKRSWARAIPEPQRRAGDSLHYMTPGRSSRRRPKPPKPNVRNVQRPEDLRA